MRFLGQLAQFTVLLLLAGAIPAELGKLRKVQTLGLSRENLRGEFHTVCFRTERGV